MHQASIPQPPPFWVFPTQQLLWLHKCFSCVRTFSLSACTWGSAPRLFPSWLPPSPVPLLWTRCHAVSSLSVFGQPLPSNHQPGPYKHDPYIHHWAFTIPGPSAFSLVLDSVDLSLSLVIWNGGRGHLLGSGLLLALLWMLLAKCELIDEISVSRWA